MLCGISVTGLTDHHILYLLWDFTFWCRLNNKTLNRWYGSEVNSINKNKFKKSYKFTLASGFHLILRGLSRSPNNALKPINYWGLFVGHRETFTAHKHTVRCTWPLYALTLGMQPRCGHPNPSGSSSRSNVYSDVRQSTFWSFPFSVTLLTKRDCC